MSSILRQLELMGIDEGTNQPQPRAVGGALDSMNQLPRTQMMSQLGGMPQQDNPAADVPQQQQQMPDEAAPHNQMAFRRPSVETQQRAMLIVRALRNHFDSWRIAWPERAIPENERVLFLQQFEKLHNFADHVDKWMLYYACFLEEDGIRRVVLMISITKKQRDMLSGSVQRFIIETKHIGECQQILSMAATHVQNRLHQIRNFEQQEMQQRCQQQAQQQDFHNSIENGANGMPHQ
ncbi:hypothetical protein EIP86_001573 [Pleurotus ostreatoroseus]|nr:hypothetical protein EIP86_001573 [Pleurotus ostreatoroseus]